MRKAKNPTFNIANLQIPCREKIKHRNQMRREKINKRVKMNYLQT